MRAAPPVQLTLTRFGAWHGALAVLTAMALTALSAWAVFRSTPLGPTTWCALALAGGTCLAAALAGRGRPSRLAWDGQDWRAGPGSAPVETLPAGRMTVCMDLGHWLMLRFEPLDAAAGRRLWLPVQPGGLAAGQWHALRCAVYSPAHPLPVAGDDPRGA